LFEIVKVLLPRFFQIAGIEKEGDGKPEEPKKGQDGTAKGNKRNPDYASHVHAMKRKVKIFKY
jgi:hypothetical protein